MLASASSSAIAAIALLSLGGGYALLAGLWIFVFREKPQERVARREREAALMRLHQSAMAPEPGERAGGQASPDTAPPVQAPSTGHLRPLQIDRRRVSRFRRR